MASAKQVKLKKLMKEQIQSRKKVEHPLARYNNVGQLTCIICNVTVKSEILWSSHLQSKKHKEVRRSSEVYCCG
jgi:zinc finger protein 830